MSRYRYTPLDPEAKSTRLLSLLPGSFHDEIHVSLGIMYLDEKPVYEALSYTWGSTDNPVRISVDVPTYTISALGGHLDVTQNLAVALRYLRSETQPRDLWIDAICVDQQNSEERGHQVQQMGSIFHQAERVRIWLGPESHNSSLAIDTLSSLATQVEVDWGLLAIRPANTSVGDEIGPEWRPDTSYNKDTWLTLFRFVARPWFRRLWIWQEVLLAKTAEMQCGHDTLDWGRYRKAFFALYSASSPTFAGALSQDAIIFRDESVQYSYNLVSRIAFKFTFEGLLDSTRDCHCADPRDRVYALINILHPSDPIAGLEPDYNKQPYLVFRDVILARLHRRGDLRMLAECELHNGDSAGNVRHSWIPDWSKPRTCLRFVSARASWGSIAKAQVLDSGFLQATGCLAAKISYIEEVVIDSHTTLDAIRRLIERIKVYRPLVEESQIIEELCRVLYVNMFSDSLFPPSANLAQYEDILYELLDESQRLSRNSRGFWAGVQHYSRGRRLFISSNGSIGLGPDTAEPSDYICVVLGCKSPLVVRKSENGNYRIVGECYVYGMMESETLLGPLPGRWQGVIIYKEGEGNMEGYIDRQTGETRYDDPRLGQLPFGWRLKDANRRPDWNNWFINDETGEQLRWPIDPRMTPEALEARGVNLQDFIFE
ncbi:MAG: hypothetical protein Q9168_006532 [Polycauliona sp. 1 TL-2023]